MNVEFGKKVAAAAAAGLMGVACGGGSTPAGAPDESMAPAAGEEAAPAEGEAMPDEAAGMDDMGSSEAKDCCRGRNECKGKGNCKTDTHGCAGKNDCKGQGGCNAHCPQ